MIAVKTVFSMLTIAVVSLVIGLEVGASMRVADVDYLLKQKVLLINRDRVSNIVKDGRFTIRGLEFTLEEEGTFISKK